MKRSTKHLDANKKKQLNEITRIIISIAKPDKIILFGIFASQEPSLEISQFPPALQVYDLLIITQKGNSKEIASLQSSIEEKCSIHAPASLTIHDLEYVNDRLLEGNYFFYQIHEHGILIYSNSKSPLVSPSRPHLRKTLKKAEEDFKRWSTQALHFYSCARFSKDNGLHRTCIFLLHQTAEQMYQAILLTHTGYKPTTHNLYKLRKASAKFSSKLSQVFPDKTDYDCRLFHILFGSYIGARYTEGYYVADDDLEALVERMGHFLVLGQTICRLYLQFLRKLELHQDTNHINTSGPVLPTLSIENNTYNLDKITNHENA